MHDIDNNLFYHMLVRTMKDYLSPRYARNYMGHHQYLTRWIKGYAPLYIDGLDKYYTFHQYCKEFLDIPYSNAEAIRQMAVEYKDGDEEVRRKVLRDCFGRLEEDHAHNEPDPWWAAPVAEEQERRLKQAEAQMWRRKVMKGTHPVFS